MNTHDKLIHALTDYDRKQSTKRGYNMYALSHYMEAVHNIDADLAAGADLRAALCAAFCGRLLDVCLKAVGLPKSVREEQMGGVVYVPASERV